MILISNEGINQLARVLQGRMAAVGDAPPLLDFGVIREDMSLQTNTFPVAIPATDYVVCRSVTYEPLEPLTMTWWAGESKTSVGVWGSENWATDGWQKGDAELHGLPDVNPPHNHGSKGEHNHDEDIDGKHYHDVYLPKKMRRIMPGDRVLVAWVGDDAVIVDVIGKIKVDA